MTNGTVKFFNGAKGYGFISPADGGPDVFVHASAVDRAGLEGLNEGDKVSFELEQDRRSGKLAAVEIRLTGSGHGGSAARSYRPPQRDFESRGGARGGFPREPAQRGSGGAAGAGTGVVKWFNEAKGFGFIRPDGGGEDVFVHVTAVERAGLRGLQEGEAIAYDLEQDRRTGKASATNLRIIS